MCEGTYLSEACTLITTKLKQEAVQSSPFSLDECSLYGIYGSSPEYKSFKRTFG